MSPNPGRMCVCQGLPQADNPVIFSSACYWFAADMLLWLSSCWGWHQSLDGMLPELASPKTLLLTTLIIQLLVFQSRMAALLEPGLEDPVCRHEPTWQCVSSTGFCDAGTALPACRQPVLVSIHWKCSVFLPSRDSKVLRGDG